MRTRRRAVAVLCTLIASVPLAATVDARADQDVDLGRAGIAALGDPEAAVEPLARDEDEPARVEQPVTATIDTARIASMTRPQLRRLAQRLHKAWVAAQGDVQRAALARDVTDARVDAALAAYAQRLTAAFDAGDVEAVERLKAARTEMDPATRNELLAVMAPAERAVIDAIVRTRVAADDAAAAVQERQRGVLVAGANLDVVRDTLEDRTPTVAKEPSIDAKYVFATGPIPGIGYWGSMSGGGMLTGWSSMAAAALGGVGCDTPPSPDLKATGVTEQGEASWYGPGFDGRNTASGEIYDQNAMTAAHKTLPFGSVVRVASQATGRCTFVTINDRGPFVDGRIIDLSASAAQAIGMDGVAPVQIEVWASPGAASPAA